MYNKFKTFYKMNNIMEIYEEFGDYGSSNFLFLITYNLNHELE